MWVVVSGEVGIVSHFRSAEGMVARLEGVGASAVDGGRRLGARAACLAAARLRRRCYPVATACANFHIVLAGGGAA